jgi:hypothetical protein
MVFYRDTGSLLNRVKKRKRWSYATTMASINAGIPTILMTHFRL